MGQILTMNWFYHRKIGLDIPGYWKQIFPLILKMIVVVAFSAGVIYWIPVSGWLGLILRGIVYVAIYLAAGWLFIWNSYEKNLVTGFVKKLRS